MAGDIQAVLKLSDCWSERHPCLGVDAPFHAGINELVTTDLETLVSEVLSPFPKNSGFADGLFVMTTATDHKNNLNRSVLKKDYTRTLRVETIANSAGGTAQVSIVAQHRIPKHQVLLQWFSDGGYGRLSWPNHRRTHPVQILDPAGIPLRYDGAHGHGPGGCDHSMASGAQNRRILHS